MQKFIYVFNSDAKDRLVASGYKLLKSDHKNSTYVFENNSTLKFEKLDISYILSDTLTF